MQPINGTPRSSGCVVLEGDGESIAGRRGANGTTVLERTMIGVRGAVCALVLCAVSGALVANADANRWCGAECMGRISGQIRDCRELAPDRAPPYPQCLSAIGPQFDACLTTCTRATDSPISAAVVVVGFAILEFSPGAAPPNSTHTVPIEPKIEQNYILSISSNAANEPKQVGPITVTLDGAEVLRLSDGDTKIAVENTLWIDAGSHLIEVRSGKQANGTLMLILSDRSFVAPDRP